MFTDFYTPVLYYQRRKAAKSLSMLHIHSADDDDSRDDIYNSLA